MGNRAYSGASLLLLDFEITGDGVVVIVVNFVDAVAVDNLDVVTSSPEERGREVAVAILNKIEELVLLVFSVSSTRIGETSDSTPQ